MEGGAGLSGGRRLRGGDLTGCWGSTEALGLVVLNFSATGDSPPPPNAPATSCKIPAVHAGLGGLATGQAQTLLAPCPPGSPGTPWESRGLSRPSTRGWGPHPPGGPTLAPARRPATLTELPATLPEPSRRGKWPPGCSFQQEASLPLPYAVHTLNVLQGERA